MILSPLHIPVDPYLLNSCVEIRQRYRTSKLPVGEAGTARTSQIWITEEIMVDGSLVDHKNLSAHSPSEAVVTSSGGVKGF